MISKNKQANIVLLHGNDEFLVDQNARNVLKELCPDAEAQGVLTTVRGDVDKVEDALKALRETQVAIQSFSMFGDENVTWLREVKFLSGAAYKSNEVKESVEGLGTTLKAGLGPEQTLVISVSGKLDARSRFLKAVQEVGKVYEYSKSTKPWEVEKEDMDLLTTLLAQRKIKAGPAVLEVMLDRIGGGTRMLVQEVEKLDLYLGDRRDLTREDVELMISPLKEVAAYTFGEAVAKGEVDRALWLLKQMETQKVSSIAVVAQLHNQFREMALYRGLLAKGMARLSSGSSRFGNKLELDASGAEAVAVVNGDRKSSPFRQAQLAGQSMRFSPAQLDRMSRMTAEAYRQQFLSGLPGFLQLELLVLRLLTPQTKSTVS
ncbi:MAG: hypothetical protein JJU29_04385 [Verrucomicrobia bacterium]|nr:hypothetical protein [Verrucomicrobiota bacterium]MCH8512073.1 hypothetical protein [Kiritimatiellia bacterium]